MKKALLLLCTLATLLAFGKTGHRIVGKIAENHLSESAKAEIKKLLGNTNLAAVSNWADFIRSYKKWKHAGSWHYTTVPDGKTYENSRTPENRGKLVEKIAEFRKTLANPNASKEDREIALKFLVHLIGDLHQPLHVGNGKDKGGNDLKVKFMWEKPDVSLHVVWDTKLILHQELSYTEYASTLEEMYSAKEKQKWQASEVVDWVHESQKYRAQVYNVKNNKISYRYIADNEALLNKRLIQAGVRLAKVLNEIFNA